MLDIWSNDRANPVTDRIDGFLDGKGPLGWCVIDAPGHLCQAKDAMCKEIHTGGIPI